MSLILLSILIFLLGRIWKNYFSKNHHEFLSKMVLKHLKIFTIIADVLFALGIGFQYLISSLEPLLLYFLSNFKEIPTILNPDSISEVLDTFVIAKTSTSNFSLVSVILLAYCSMMLVPILLAVTYLIIAALKTTRRVAIESGFEKLPEILPRTKLFLRLCQLRN
jgi:hypothetical protein